MSIDSIILYLKSCVVLDRLAVLAFFWQFFKDLVHKESKCVIVVTHSHNVCNNCDEIYKLKPIKNASKKGRVDLFLRYDKISILCLGGRYEKRYRY